MAISSKGDASVPRPAITQETDYSYIDKSVGRSRSFSPKLDEAMVTFREHLTQDVLAEVVSSSRLRSVSQGFNPQRGFAAVYVDARDGEDAAAAALEAQPAVANAIPVDRTRATIVRIGSQRENNVAQLPLTLLRPSAAADFVSKSSSNFRLQYKSEVLCMRRRERPELLKSLLYDAALKRGRIVTTI